MRRRVWCTLFVLCGLTPQLHADYSLFINVETGLSLEVGSGSKDAGGLVFNQFYNGEPYHEWEIEPITPNTLRIRNKHSQLYLAVPSGITAIQSAKTEQKEQIWTIEKADNDELYLKNASNGLYLQPLELGVAQLGLGEKSRKAKWKGLEAWDINEDSLNLAFLSRLKVMKVREENVQSYEIDFDLRANRFEKVIAQAKPDTKAYQQALLGLAHVDLVEGKYDASLARYEQLVKIGADKAQKWDLAAYIRLAKGLKNLPAITPAQEYRVLLIHLTGTDIDGQKRKLYPQHAERAYLSLRLLQKWLLVATKGKVLLDIHQKTMKANVTTLSLNRLTFAHNTLSGPEGSENFAMETYLKNEVNNYDHILYHWNADGIISAAYGGVHYVNLIGDRITLPLRGVTQIPSYFFSKNTDLLGITLHEVFHTFEGIGGISPEHGFLDTVRSAFPGWKGSTEEDYYSWQFATNKKLQDAKNFNFRINAYIVPDIQWNQELAFFSRYSLSDRIKAFKLVAEANDLWEKGSFQDAKALYEESRQLYPAYSLAWTRAPMSEPAIEPGKKAEFSGLFELPNIPFPEFTIQAEFLAKPGNDLQLISFEDHKAGQSSSKDRLLQYNSKGQIEFFVWPFKPEWLSTTKTWTDGAWHTVRASFSKGRMLLWVDSVLVGEKQVGASLYNFYGFWRITESPAVRNAKVWNMAMTK